MVQEMEQVFADGVGRTLIPRSVGEGLLRRENFHEAAGKMVHFIGLRNMPVQRGGIELRQNVNAPEAGVDAVRDGDVHQAVFAGEGHGGFGAVLRQRKQPGALAAAHDDAENLAGVGGLADAGHKKLCLIAGKILIPIAAKSKQEIDAVVP